MNVNNDLIGLAVGGISLITGIAKGFGVVKEGQLGSKTFFGKAIRTRDGNIKVTEPGFVLLIPFVHSMQKAHIRMDSLELNNLNVTLKNGLSYQYSAFVAYHVSEDPADLEKYMYKVEDPHILISQKLSSEIRELLSEEVDPLQAKGSVINAQLKKVLEDYLLDKIGITLDSCGLTSLTESAQAQQVNVTVSKVKYAQEIFGTEKVPENILAACFGATPVTSTNTVSSVTVSKKKDETFFEKLQGFISVEKTDDEKEKN